MIPLFKVFMSPTAGEEVTKVLNSGYIGQGPKVDELEKNLSDYFNRDRIFTLNSATSAEHLVLHLLKKPMEKYNWTGSFYMVTDESSLENIFNVLSKEGLKFSIDSIKYAYFIDRKKIITIDSYGNLHTNGVCMVENNEIYQEILYKMREDTINEVLE